MRVLGIHVGHDSSAALIIDGQVVADVAEERFNRIKHSCSIPRKSVEYCLNSQNLTMDDIDIIAIPSKKNTPKLNYLLDLPNNKVFRRSKRGQILDIYNKLANKREKGLPLYIKKLKVSNKTELIPVEHHLAHAASAYYTNPINEKQLIVTMDGAGDSVSVGIWRGENNRIIPLKRISNDGSLGWFYSNVTEALGWVHGDGEGKTMGLAPYGDYNKAKGILEKYHPKYVNGELVERKNYGKSNYWDEEGSMQFHFDEANEIKELIKLYGKENVAAEAQRILEEQAFEIIFPWLDKESTKNLSCSGGIFLNVKLNQKIWEKDIVKSQHIYPNAGDSGLAVGAALCAYFKDNPNAFRKPLNNLYHGPAYSNNEIEAILKLRNLKYHYVDNIEQYTAKLLANNKIVAWFQGRMESGPRALGNRSILMSANNPENKDIINSRVKFREAFRPFCPSLLWEKKNDYLEKARDEDYMITSFTCVEDKRKKVPAVVHADYTLRPQTVKKEANERYWNLINEFGKITGEYLVLNTSMNIMGEPIVNKPSEAIRCFYDNGLDHLVLGNFILSKE